MDVMGGAGICRGPHNTIGNGYMGLPIAITVEGANILTRSMITFGQGLNRAHPHLIKIVNSLEKGDDVKGFTSAVSSFLGHLVANSARSLTLGLTPRFKPSGGGQKLSDYYQGHLARQAANFALCADLALVLGGRLKFEEMLSGRFADAFGTLYLGYSCLWYHQRNLHVEEIDQVLEMALETLLLQNQAALKGIAANFPVPVIGSVMTAFCLPLGSRHYTGPTDDMRKRVSTLITTPTAVRTLLTQNIFISQNPEDRVRQLVETLPDAVKADAAVAAAKKAKRPLSAEEQALVQRVTAMADKLIQVDVFDKLGIEKHEGDSYVRPALRGTKFVTATTTAGVKRANPGATAATTNTPQVKTTVKSTA
jgi:acyl-CoA dehydrogenase